MAIFHKGFLSAVRFAGYPLACFEHTTRIGNE
jgi:hypothetical protein